MTRNLTLRLDAYDRDAQRMIHAAQALADERKHPEVEPLHLLHRLLERNEGTQAIVRRAGADPTEALLEAEQLVRRMPKADGVVAYFSPRMHDLLARAEGEGARDKGSAITNTHLLLALVLDTAGPVAQVFKRVGLTSTIVRGALQSDVNDARGSSPAVSGSGGASVAGSARGKDPIEANGIDLVARARSGALDPVIGRDGEVRRMLQVLARRFENNPLLAGEPGIGKTAIVHALAQRIASGDVPAVVAGKRLVWLELATVLAGARLKSEGEDRVRQLLAAARDAGDVILVLPDLSSLVGDRAQPGLAALLGSALGRGELRAIGLASPSTVKKLAEEEPSLSRRFVGIVIEPPSPEEAVAIVRGIVHRYEAKHAVRIADTAIQAAVRLSRRYVPSANLPKVAIDLIDEAAARARVELDGKPADVDAAERRLERLEAEIRSLADDTDDESNRTRGALEVEANELRPKVEAQRAAWSGGAAKQADLKRMEAEMLGLQKRYDEATQAGDHGRAGELRFGAIPLLEKQLGEARAQVGTLQLRNDRVTESDVADVIAAWTGVPVSRMLQAEQDRLLQMEHHLTERVVGQDLAVSAVSKAVRRGRVGLRDARRPIGSFLFLGPTGVGKTELAKALAEFLFDDDASLTRLDMSEFMEKHMVARLLGSPPGYVDSEEGGFLTEAVRRRPYSVVLFDEMEKAHPDVFNILLQVLDDGRLTDSRGQLAHFSDTVVIMTSNVGSPVILDHEFPPDPEDGGGDDEEVQRASRDSLRKKLEGELRGHFRPEFLNRIDDVVIFEPLGKKELRGIVEIQLRGLAKMLADRRITLSVSDAAKARLVDLGHEPAFGARPLRRVILKNLQDPLAEAILRGGYAPGDTVLVDVKEEVFTFEKKQVGA
ncbi:MAG: AAA family ATPase [Deltaproteobacteria bacterium]|nr:AAA family ATPase [Deltaproteobacteria bacterium]